MVSHSPSLRIGIALFLISAATLTFEINLNRLFSVTQFYHFAFLVVSVALLGFGASGTILAIFPKIGQRDPQTNLGWLAIMTGISMLGAFLLTNWLPFDSFSIAWDSRQVWILIMHYLALASPFFFSGMAVGILLTAYSQVAGGIYAVNLSGAAVGCVIALAAPPYIGGEGSVTLSCGLAALAAVICLTKAIPTTNSSPASDESSDQRYLFSSVIYILLTVALVLFFLVDFGLRISGNKGLKILDLHLSPYKSLSYALLYPDSEVISQRWNAFSRVDLVRSAGIRSLPGLSYRYLELPPPEDGLLMDGDELSPVVHPNADLSFADFLPSALAFRMRSNANTLVLEPRGGLDIITALTLGAGSVTAVEVNPLNIEAAKHIYSDPRVQLVVESGRSYARKSNENFDVIIFSLATSYHPVRSGAYSLAEDYRNTLESYQDALELLNPDGILVITRWLQDIPSESLRAFGLGVTALESSGINPKENIIAIRGYNTATIFVKNNPFSPDEIELIKEFADKRAFDLIYAPGLSQEDVNQHNILQEPVYYQAFTELLDTSPRSDFYRNYTFDVSPPNDDHPFFGHYFKWSQTKQVMVEFGKTWQPFGGAGYFVVLALLVLSTVLASVIILLPAVTTRARNRELAPKSGAPERFVYNFLVYFGLIGIAYLLVEIPLIQRFILFLGHPSYAMTTVLFTLLLFSGLGSSMSRRIPLKLALVILVFFLLFIPSLLPVIINQTLGLALTTRIGLTVILLAPVGFLMGIPFPGGIRWMILKNHNAPSIPWVWGVNGAASVIAAVLAALLALSFGFNWVFRLGALCYAGALLLVWLATRQDLALPPPQ